MSILQEKEKSYELGCKAGEVAMLRKLFKAGAIKTDNPEFIRMIREIRKEVFDV